ncbi:helix-hairpin-helix domain-containing protein [Rhizobium indicum]|uniref:Protein kinase domain-containing protein n=1 Tax=Rhizobium indicum TaxID=2583231 RepID=A0ABX6PIE8_9HYPH|nr:protein kinase domain-containing protein [Rhizobium indicum]QKK18874.1 protein kinase domain-containing protein [Rhizobium indicum]
MTTVICSDGRRLTLGATLGKGGEGAVHHIVESADIAAKIYNPGKAKDRRDKVNAMVSDRLHTRSDYVAFPIEALKSPSGEFLGFTMKKVAGFKSVHDLYGPGSRKTEFPTADSQFLLRSAINLANAVASIHATGCVIGDINHSGILVSNKALVTLIDSDSFQYRSGPNTYRSLVGVAEYTPPELQGATFSKVDRTPIHDNFGLAVLIFQLLFLGRHPFAGRYLGKGDMDIKTAIGAGRFAYSARKTETMMEPPPFVPGLGDYGEDVRKALEAAFMPPARQPGGRPTAASWSAILKGVEATLAVCTVDKSHAYKRELSSCPWCKLEKTMGRSLFPAHFSPAAPVMDIGQLLNAIKTMPAPPSPPNAESVIGPLASLTMSQTGKSARNERNATVAAGVIAVGVGLYLMAQVSGFWGIALSLGAIVIAGRSLDLKTKFASELNGAKAGWEEQHKNWVKKAGPEAFEARRSHYIALGATHSGLPAKEREKLAALEQKKRQLQLDKHMDAHLIDRAKIPRVGPGRKATLASYGFESALDVRQRSVTGVPGFGPSLASEIEGWARTVERKFVYNASIPTDPAAVQAAKSEIAKQRAEIERDLLKATADLKHLADTAQALRTKPPQQLIDAYTRLKQVELDIG